MPYMKKKNFLRRSIKGPSTILTSNATPRVGQVVSISLSWFFFHLMDKTDITHSVQGDNSHLNSIVWPHLLIKA